VVECLLERDDCVATGLFGYAFESAVNDALSETLLAVKKNLVDELRDDGRAVNRVGYDGTLRGWTLTWHYFFSIFAP
jgi:hypothetical protein